MVPSSCFAISGMKPLHQKSRSTYALPSTVTMESGFMPRTPPHTAKKMFLSQFARPTELGYGEWTLRPRSVTPERTSSAQSQASARLTPEAWRIRLWLACRWEGWIRVFPEGEEILIRSASLVTGGPGAVAALRCASPFGTRVAVAPLRRENWALFAILSGEQPDLVNVVSRSQMGIQTAKQSPIPSFPG